MKHLLFIIIATFLAACGSDKKSTPEPELSEVRSIGKVADTDIPYLFNSASQGKINYRGSCKSDRKLAHSGINRITLKVIKEGIYSDCSLQVIDESGTASDVLHVSRFEVDVPKTETAVTNYVNSTQVDTKFILNMDEYGSLIRDSHTSSTGTRVYNFQYDRDAQGRITHERIDNNNDGAFDKEKTIKRRTDGELLQLVTREIKTNEISETINLTYKNSDKNILIQWLNAKNEIVHSRTLTKDARGNIVSVLVDIDGNGIIDDAISREYDSKNNLLTEKIDVDPSTPETYATEVFTYDQYGQTKTLTFINDESSQTSKITYTFDEKGQKLKAEADNMINGKLDGKIDSITTYTYDEHGSVLTINEDNNANGKLTDKGDVVTTYTYTY